MDIQEGKLGPESPKLWVALEKELPMRSFLLLGGWLFVLLVCAECAEGGEGVEMELTDGVFGELLGFLGCTGDEKALLVFGVGLVFEQLDELLFVEVTLVPLEDALLLLVGGRG